MELRTTNGGGSALMQMLKSVWPVVSSRGPEADVGVFVLRMTCGLSLALAHGIWKFPIEGGFLAQVARMGLPMPEFLAWAAALSETAGGLLLAVGLFTRPAAMAVIGTMAVVLFDYHAGHPYEHKELSVLYLAMALGVCGTGPGRWSVDALFARRRAQG